LLVDKLEKVHFEAKVICKSAKAERLVRLPNPWFLILNINFNVT